MKNGQLTPKENRRFTTKKKAAITAAVGIGALIVAAGALRDAAIGLVGAGSTVIDLNGNQPVMPSTSPGVSGSNANDGLLAGTPPSAPDSTSEERLLDATPPSVPVVFPGGPVAGDGSAGYKDQTGRWIPIDKNEVIEYEPLPFQALPHQASGSYKILSVIPTDEMAFRNIFQTDMSLSAQSEMEKYRSWFGTLNNSTILNTAEQSESDFYRLLKQDSQGRIVIIIGHSEEINAGQYIILPNGQAVSISDIHQTCRDLRADCLVLTCYSDDFSLDGAISLDDAYQMTLAGIKQLEAVQRGDTSVPSNIVEALHSGSLTQSDLLIVAMRTERAKLRASRLKMIGVSLVMGGTLLKWGSTYQVGDR